MNYDQKLNFLRTTEGQTKLIFLRNGIKLRPYVVARPTHPNS